MATVRPVLIPILAATLLAAACSTPPRESPPALPAAKAARQAAPAAPDERPPRAIYREPRIGAVYLRAHEDARGRLLGPQVMYEVVDPGGWNVGALDSGEPGAALPPESEREPEARLDGGVAGRGAPPEAPASPLLDPDTAARVVITGLMRPEDRARAEALSARRPGSSAVYDPEAGWLLVPN